MDLINKDIDQLIESLDETPTKSVNGIWYRYHNPAWAWSPYAGTGAKLCGGRFNPKGTSALYLADTPESALREVTAGTGPNLIQPWLLCSYAVQAEGILDLTDSSNVFDTPWRLQLLEKAIPPGWQLCQHLKHRKDIAGVLVPSFQSHGNNLVLFRYRQTELQIFDPEQRLRHVFGSQLCQAEWG